MGTRYAVTVAWYLGPGGEDPYTAVPAEQRDGYYDVPPLAAGGYDVVGTPPGNVQTQGMAGYRGTWQNDDQLWWTGAKPGDKLELIVSAPDEATYDLSGVFTKARDYGIVQLYLDGAKIGDRLDLYNPGVIATDPLPLGRKRLTAGEHVLTVEILGANEAADKAYMFGFDRLILDKTTNNP